MTAYIYPPELSDAFLSLGLAPTPGTPPSLVREHVDDLYKYELRALRNRLLMGEFDRPEYLQRIIVLRKKYLMLMLPLPAWENLPIIDLMINFRAIAIPAVPVPTAVRS